MPRFAHIFEAAADTLNAYYQAVAEVNIDSLMGLWIDEEFVSCICADGSPRHGRLRNRRSAPPGGSHRHAHHGVHDLRDGPRARRMAHRAHSRESDAQ